MRMTPTNFLVTQSMIDAEFALRGDMRDRIMDAIKNSKLKVLPWPLHYVANVVPIDLLPWVLCCNPDVNDQNTRLLVKTACEAVIRAGLYLAPPFSANAKRVVEHFNHAVETLSTVTPSDERLPRLALPTPADRNETLMHLCTHAYNAVRHTQRTESYPDARFEAALTLSRLAQVNPDCASSVRSSIITYFINNATEGT